jgi:hypothetical protein
LTAQLPPNSSVWPTPSIAQGVEKHLSTNAPLKNPCIETSFAKIGHLEVTLGRCLGHQDGALMSGINDLIKRGQGTAPLVFPSLLPSEDTAFQAPS